jgi:hypothetical protein
MKLIRYTTKTILFPPPLIRYTADPDEARQSIVRYYLRHSHLIPLMAAKCAVKMVERREMWNMCVLVMHRVVDLASLLFHFVDEKIWF